MIYNVTLELRQKDEAIQTVRSHNIWAIEGQHWLCQLVSESAPGAYLQDNRLRYMGFGSGGIHAVPKGFQTAWQENISRLERPLEVSPGMYLKEFTAAKADTIEPISEFGVEGMGRITIVTSFSEDELSIGGPVELTEVGLFHAGADPSRPDNEVLGYDIFPAVLKTSAHNLRVTWEVIL